MAEGQGTLNETGGTGDSSQPVELIAEGGLVSTTEIRPVQDSAGEEHSSGGGDDASAETENTEGATEGEDEAKDDSPSSDEGDAAEAEETEEEKEKEPFHKIPRFQQLISEKNELKARVESLEAMLAAREGAAAERGEDGESFKDITTIPDDELMDWYAENPKQFLANLATQIRSEVMSEVRQEQEAIREAQATREMAKTFAKYESENPDFSEMWESGVLEAFMRDNPGHNAISAHLVLTQEKREAERKKEIDAAVAKAVKETEEKLKKHQTAKQTARTLTGSPSRSGVSHGIPQELKDPKRFGGEIAVLAKRLAARRAKSGG